jgi:hypothetical protein
MPELPELEALRIRVPPRLVVKRTSAECCPQTIWLWETQSEMPWESGFSE